MTCVVGGVSDAAAAAAEGVDGLLGGALEADLVPIALGLRDARFLAALILTLTVDGMAALVSLYALQIVSFRLDLFTPASPSVQLLVRTRHSVLIRINNLLLIMRKQNEE